MYTQLYNFYSCAYAAAHSSTSFTEFSSAITVNTAANGFTSWLFRLCICGGACSAQSVWAVSSRFTMIYVLVFCFLGDQLYWQYMLIVMSHFAARAEIRPKVVHQSEACTAVGFTCTNSIFNLVQLTIISTTVTLRNWSRKYIYFISILLSIVVYLFYIDKNMSRPKFKKTIEIAYGMHIQI